MGFWDHFLGRFSQKKKEEEPDPVDNFEDRLARDLGLLRHPNCSLRSWRRIRVSFLDQRDQLNHEQPVRTSGSRH